MARTIIDKGTNGFNSLVEFTKSDMKMLCTTISCPGGRIINTRANIVDQTPTILDSGHFISMVSEKRILMTAYAEMHQARISRTIDSQSMN